MARTRGAAALKVAAAKAQSGPKRPKVKAGKRVKVKPGDLVMMADNMSPFRHVIGQVVVVKEIIDKNRVIVEAVAPGDRDYLGVQAVALTRKPGGYTANGGPKHEWHPWINQVLNVRERIVEKIVEVPAKRVITTHEELSEVLAEEGDASNVVVKLPSP